MLKDIIEVLTGIGDAFSAILDFMQKTVNDTIYVVQLTGSFVTKIPDYLSWLPSPVIVLFISIFAVVVVYKILGREG